MKRHLKILYPLVFMLSLTACLAPVVPEPEPEPEPEQIAYRVNASEMFDLHEENEAAWLERYGGKLCAVSGYVWNILAEDDEITIVIRDRVDRIFAWGRELWCDFDLSHTHAIAQLHDEQWITVVGRCSAGGIIGMKLEDSYIESQ